MLQPRFVCTLDELPPGRMKLVDVGKFGVDVYNVRGSLHAIVNYCSHEGAPLCQGLIGGTNESAPEEPDRLCRVRDGQIVRCPWHNWEFDAVGEIERRRSPETGAGRRSRAVARALRQADVRTDLEAAAAHGLPVAVHINGGNGVDHPPTFAGHARTYPGYAAFMPMNYFVHQATLIVEGVFGRHPGLTFVFADGGYDILTPLMWRLDTFWLSMRDQTPWVDRYPSEYLPDHVRFCSSAFDGPVDTVQARRWMDFSGKAGLVMYGSSYPHWSTSAPEIMVAGLDDAQRDKVLWRNAGELYGLKENVL